MGAELVPALAGRYRTLLADPPWPERGSGKIKRGADRHYPLMPVRDICNLGPELQSLIDPVGCHLWLWVTGNYLRAGFEVMDAWGFRYVNYRPWIKGEETEDGEIEMQNAGLGQYIRGDSELLLLGVRGNLPYRFREDGKRAQCRQSLIAPRTDKHSEKPEQSYSDIELVSHGPYLELFCRTPRPGWHSWGNEVAPDVLLNAPTAGHRPEVGAQLSLLGRSQ